MGIGYWDVSPEIIVGICQGLAMSGGGRYFEVVGNPLPEDAEVVGIDATAEPAYIRIAISSSCIDGLGIQLPRPEMRTIHLFHHLPADAPRAGHIERFEGVGPDFHFAYYFRIRNAAGEILAHSEAHASEEARERCIDVLRGVMLDSDFPQCESSEGEG